MQLSSNSCIEKIARMTVNANATAVHRILREMPSSTCISLLSIIQNGMFMLLYVLCQDSECLIRFGVTFNSIQVHKCRAQHFLQPQCTTYASSIDKPQLTLPERGSVYSRARSPATLSFLQYQQAMLFCIYILLLLSISKPVLSFSGPSSKWDLNVAIVGA